MSGAQNAWIAHVMPNAPLPMGAVPVVPVGPVPAPVIPPAFTAAANQLQLLDDPPQTSAQDAASLQTLRQPATQAVAQQDFANAPGLVAALAVLHARVIQAIPVQQSAIALRDALDAEMNRLPDAVSQTVASVHPVTPRLDAMQLAARTHTAATNFAALAAEGAAIQLVITAFQASINAVAAPLARLGALLTQFPAIPSQEAAKLTDLSKRFFTKNNVRDVEWTELCNKIEAAVTPDSKGMQTLRQQPANATGINPAVDVLGRMVLAGIVGIKTSGPQFYESSYDLLLDHFGGSWGLESRGGSGKLQWLNEWEFHIHGAAIRAAGVVTGFNILAGHIKPTAQQRVTGLSVQITDAATLASVSGGSGAAFARWAATAEGTQTLSRKKRGQV